MLYAEYDFYINQYYGELLEPENSNRWLSRASDEIDNYTFGRLRNAFPTDEISVEKIKKAVCEIAEALYCINEQLNATAMKKSDDGTYHGAVSSISSGRESISYSQGNSSANAYMNAASDVNAKNRLIQEILFKHLSCVSDSNGTNLLFAGVDLNVSRHGHYI